MINLKQLHKLLENQVYSATIVDKKVQHLLVKLPAKGKYRAYPGTLLDDECHEYINQNPVKKEKDSE